LHKRKNIGKIEKEPVSCGRDQQTQWYILHVSEIVRKEL
jgi:hypothetical protein